MADLLLFFPFIYHYKQNVLLFCSQRRQKHWQSYFVIVLFSIISQSHQYIRTITRPLQLFSSLQVQTQNHLGFKLLFCLYHSYLWLFLLLSFFIQKNPFYHFNFILLECYCPFNCVFLDVVKVAFYYINLISIHVDCCAFIVNELLVTLAAE